MGKQNTGDVFYQAGLPKIPESGPLEFAPKDYSPNPIDNNLFSIIGTLIIGIIITTSLYFHYKHKQIKLPFKISLKRSWYWRIVTYIILSIILRIIEVLYLSQWGKTYLL